MWRAASKGISKWGNELTTQIKIDIENYWREYVTRKNKEFVANKQKYYVLSMFPYPSGNLHMGHVRVYTISDSIARFHQMNGYDVIHPMGWDSFGLPAENAALERNLSPNKWTTTNISKMKEQLLELGCNFDWDREISTSDPSYYKYTQSLFLDLYKAGLIYKKPASVNWDPIDKTVLADEQVDINGCSWRSGAKVEKKLLNQWFVKTTRFAKQLYDGLDDPSLLEWKDIILMQKHWIGECTGINIDFNLLYSNPTDKTESIKTLTAWTDKPETVMNSKFIAVPSNSILNNSKFVSYEGENYKKLTIFAENPLTDQKLPIYVTDEIPFAEGSDAHIGSPEINDSDKTFAFLANMMIDETVSFDVHGSELAEMRKEVCEKAQKMGVGGYPTSSKLKDWLISRQRYWGTPIPIINCESCGFQPVQNEELPVILPDIEITSTDSGESPLCHAKDWLNTTCPKCGGKATRETDTMDTFVDSSWYYLRYLDSKNSSAAFQKENVWQNMPVDLYVGGKEHAVLHLYYARFMSHFLNSIGKLPIKEPFQKLLVQGMVFGKTYKIKETGRYIPEKEVKIVNESRGQAFTLDYGLPVEIAWEKMSKSKFNGVDPSQMFNDYSCDTTRLIMLGNITPMSHRRWSTDTFPGILKWQQKLWSIIDNFQQFRINDVLLKEKENIANLLEFKVNENKLMDSRNHFVVLSTFHFKYTNQLSVAISNLQSLTKTLLRVPKNFIPVSSEYERLLATQIIMLAPFAPHFASEMWAGFLQAENRINTLNAFVNWEKNVLEQTWPIVDKTYQLELLCLINGEQLCRIKLMPDDINNLKLDQALSLAMEEETIKDKLKHDIDNIDFKVYNNCRAFINIKTKNNLKTTEKLIEVMS